MKQTQNYSGLPSHDTRNYLFLEFPETVLILEGGLEMFSPNRSYNCGPKPFGLSVCLKKEKNY